MSLVERLAQRWRDQQSPIFGIGFRHDRDRDAAEGDARFWLHAIADEIDNEDLSVDTVGDPVDAGGKVSEWLRREASK